MPLALNSAVRVSSYSDYLNSITSLIGVELADFETAELTLVNTYFNRALRKIWEASNWNDICPYGEARFPTNQITYPNDYTQTTYWTATNVTVTANSTANPLDGRVTASKILETATNSTHGVSQVANFIPVSPYAASAYVCPNGRTWAYLNVNDGGATYTCFFNLASGGVVGTMGGTGAAFSANIQNLSNGFYYISMAFTSSTTAGVGSISVQLATSGTTISYAGNTALGIYCWGVTGSQTANGFANQFIIPWNQLGENDIDPGGLFDLWPNNPNFAIPSSRWNYRPVPQGINLIGCQQAAPTYLYYRYYRPLFQGADYSASATYAPAKQVYFTSTTGDGNYYVCLIQTTAGQSPDTNPLSWQVIQIPYVFFEYCVYNAYGDWLQVEGQTAKAVAMYGYAQSTIDDENDKQERQMGNIMPVRVFTHVTSQSRNGGWGGFTGSNLIINPNAQ